MRVVTVDDRGAEFLLAPHEFSNYRAAIELRPFKPTKLMIRGDYMMDAGRLRLAWDKDYYVASGYDPTQAMTLSGSVLIRTLAALKPAPVTDGRVEPAPDFRATLDDVLIEGLYQPMPHQVEAAQFKAAHTRAFDLSTMRTGKTGSTMLALEYLFRQGMIRRALVLAPLSCVRPVWSDNLARTLPLRISRPLVGTRSQREAQIRRPTDIFVGTYTAIEMFDIFWHKWKPDAIVIDEVTHYAAVGTKRTRALRTLIKDIEPAYVWGLTGTPGHDPLKAFSMSKVVNPDAVAVKSLSAWKDITMERFGPQAWQWRNRREAPAYIKQALSPAVLFKKEDLFTLPPVVYLSKEAERSDEVNRMLNQLRDQMRAVSKNGAEVTATQKSALVVKLLQCAAGAVHADDGTTAMLDINKRVQLIYETIDESERKVVLFSPFVACLRQLCTSLQGSDFKAELVDGSTPEKARRRIFTQFQEDPPGKSVDVLVAHPRTVAFGVELAAADMIIFDGAPLSGDFVFGQAVERLSSIKQAGQVTIVNIYSCREERMMYQALREGREQSEAVAELFKSVTEVTNNTDF